MIDQLNARLFKLSDDLERAKIELQKMYQEASGLNEDAADEPATLLIDSLEKSWHLIDITLHLIGQKR